MYSHKIALYASINKIIDPYRFGHQDGEGVNQDNLRTKLN